MKTIRTILFVSSFAILGGFTVAGLDSIWDKGFNFGNVVFLLIVFALWWVSFKLLRKYNGDKNPT